MKALVCTCEDVTVDEVEHAIAKGFHDIESVKRYTGFGTGMCQGKQCLPRWRGCCGDDRPAPPAKSLVPFTPAAAALPHRAVALGVGGVRPGSALPTAACPGRWG